MTTTVLPLVGKELLAFVKANASLNRSALSKQAGYVRINKDTGKAAANLLAFQDALLSAKGLELPGSDRASRHAYEAYVQRSGVLSVGAIYVQELGVGPADRFSIALINDESGVGFKLMLEERTEGSPLPIQKPKKREKAAAEAPAAVEPTEGAEYPDEEEGEEGFEDS